MQAAGGAAASRVSLGGHVEPGMRRGVSEIEEKRLGGRGRAVIDDPFFRPGGDDIRGVALAELVVDDGGVFEERERLALDIESGTELFGIMDVGGVVGRVAEEIIEAAEQRMAWLGGGHAGPLQTPFPDAGGGVARAAHDGAEGVVVLQGLVEVDVADVRVALMRAQEQRAARRGADRSRAVVAAQLHAFTGKGIELGRCDFLGADAAILKERPEIAPAHVVHQQEDDVGFGSLGANRRRQEAGEKGGDAQRFHESGNPRSVRV